MMRAPLSDFQVDILALAHEGLSNRQIAEAVSKPFACIITTFGLIKRKGYQLPTHRPLDATAEQERGRRERRGRKWTPSPDPRHTVRGVKKSTGERFEVTSDTKEFADDHLAAMLGVGDGQ